ncbi:type VI secretion system contractile sheath small subunit [Archangium lansingense]|uniref:Type VI secretion system contractile sheath small subunit n=1 Tax=Archangium lansingense TaxID=2995310 RepID=A0ABT4AAJ6_9BACT|nr:type VI secretion system contractile sheath small subunit [Archangium lansinium]MCY1078683.1 type VI secretion system contractile sheath small subunit [Archangium lansinium]
MNAFFGVRMAINDEIPKSRITLTYRTSVNGERAEKALPLRLLLMGSFSGGTSTDSQKDLDQRQIRNLDGKNLDQVMKDMDIRLQFQVSNRIDPGNSEQLDVELPIDSMKSFTPLQIARNIPKVRALLLLRKLLLEQQGNLDNRKEFRRLVRELAQNPEAVSALKKELQDFNGLKIPRPLLSAGEAPPPSDPAAKPQ